MRLTVRATPGAVKDTPTAHSWFRSRFAQRDKGVGIATPDNACDTRRYPCPSIGRAAVIPVRKMVAQEGGCPAHPAQRRFDGKPVLSATHHFNFREVMEFILQAPDNIHHP